MFVTTANTLRMPQPLLDRMEIIRLPGYTEDEKVEIAKRHLIPKQMKAHGLKKTEWSISDDALRDLIRYYTREAGVRNLEREIANLTRKAIKDILMKKTEKVAVTRRNLEKYAGVRRFRFGEAESRGSGRRDHRARLDRGRRRIADDRGGHPARQGAGHGDRQARRRDEGIGAGGRELRQVAQPCVRHPPDDLRKKGHPRPCARGRHAQGRPVGRRRHGDLDRLGADRHPGARATSR